MRWQEARVSRAVDLMVAHVENLRRRHDRSAAELEEARRVIQQQNSCRGTGDPRASPGLSICVQSWSCLVFSHLVVWLITLCCCVVAFFWEDPDDSDSRLRSYLQVCSHWTCRTISCTCTCAPWNKVKVLLHLFQNNSRRRVSISVIPSKPQVLVFFSFQRISFARFCSKYSFMFISACGLVRFGLLQEKTKQEQKKRHSHRGRKPVRSASLSSESSCSVLVKEDNNQADARSNRGRKSSNIWITWSMTAHQLLSVFYLLRPPDPGETPEQAPCAPPPTQPAAPPPPPEPEPEPEPECLSTKQPSLPKMHGKKYGFTHQRANTPHGYLKPAAVFIGAFLGLCFSWCYADAKLHWFIYWK